MELRGLVPCHTAFQQWDTEGGVGNRIAKQRKNKVTFAPGQLVELWL